ncbi:hypothetical protein AB3X94_37025 [Paraburkholderia sp. BR10923]|uniref:hypothetical protein n=1 Tax=Paraburkholderia sp. BR10923 TaxID=3236992 RepID=UPI0034CD21F7
MQVRETRSPFLYEAFECFTLMANAMTQCVKGSQRMMPGARVAGKKSGVAPVEATPPKEHYTRSPGSSRTSNVTLARREAALKKKELPL